MRKKLNIELLEKFYKEMAKHAPPQENIFLPITLGEIRRRTNDTYTSAKEYSEIKWITPLEVVNGQFDFREEYDDALYEELLIYTDKSFNPALKTDPQ